MRRKLARRGQGGFTLIELMIVVVILGVLATIGVYSVRSYIQSAKTVEAREIIASIKAGQEAYFDETFRYLNVTPTIDTFHPSGDFNGTIKFDWHNTANCAGCLAKFNTLGVTVNQPVMFRYSSTAGKRGDEVELGEGVNATLFNAPTPQGPFYLVKAVSDLNNDGSRRTIFVSSSFQADIYVEETGGHALGE